jgi:hypothetical protein
LNFKEKSFTALEEEKMQKDLDKLLVKAILDKNVKGVKQSFERTDVP